MANQAHAPSVSLLIPKACVERQTPKGPVFVPLLPVDQLPYQMQGIPLQISHRQIIKEAWQLLDETADESPTVLQVLSSLPELPKYRAPDHDVVKSGANQTLKGDMVLDGRIVAYTPTSQSVEAAAEQNRRNNDASRVTSIVQLSDNDQHFANGEESTIATESKHLNQSDLSVASANTSIGDWNSSKISQARENHLVSQGDDQAYINSAAGMIVTVADTTTESTVASHKSSSDTENDHPAKIFHHGSKTTAIGSRSNSKYSDRPKKVYCTHWIKCGECLWGEACKYKHEMPESLFQLREVTQGGLKSYPQWWKDQTAIKARSPTWFENQLRAEMEKSSAREVVTKTMALTQVPNPSTWRVSRQQGGFATIQEHGKPSVSVNESGASSRAAWDTAAVRQASVILEDPNQNVLPVSSSTRTQKKTFSPTVLRRLSQISTSSNGSEGSDRVKKRSIADSQPEITQPNIAPRPKKTGLAASIYAPKDMHDHAGHGTRGSYGTKSHSEPELLASFQKPLFERLTVPQSNLLGS